MTADEFVKYVAGDDGQVYGHTKDGRVLIVEEREFELGEPVRRDPDAKPLLPDVYGPGLAWLSYSNPVPPVDDLREVVADHIRHLEPVATSQSVAAAVHAFLIARQATRPPLPGEYADPQPVAVDTGASYQETSGDV